MAEPIETIIIHAQQSFEIAGETYKELNNIKPLGRN